MIRHASRNSRSVGEAQGIARTGRMEFDSDLADRNLFGLRR
ncbi:hypothetical protein SSAG_00278 [Streptomyces sp. Mg1]|nr:hypothetical protein SSAG_00278 [Streptomyces sp. Mg1]